MKKLKVILACVALLISSVTFASAELTTFEEFYNESSGVGWVVAVVVAIVGGALVFWTGGAASPVVGAGVAKIGTLIGAKLGYSGIVATNAGLALLGGGAVAAGGFGVAGGAAVLTAALSFSTAVVYDYSQEAYSEFKYRDLSEKSQQMSTLPLPMNGNGSEAYEAAFEELKRINPESPIFISENQKVIQTAITILESAEHDPDESAKDEALLSLLYFVSNDYVKAKDVADSSIRSSRAQDVRRTLPAFIFATSSLYEETFDFTAITENYFRYSVLAEPDNPLVSLLFSIYLDRMLLRFNDDFLSAADLDLIFEIMNSPALEKHRVVNYTILASRYFMLLKLDQQKISSLATSLNTAIKNSPVTLDEVVKSLGQYDKLVTGLRSVMNSFLVLDLNEEDRGTAVDLNDLLISYVQDRGRLQTLVDDLRLYQAGSSDSDSSESGVFSYWLYGVALVLFLAFLMSFWFKANIKGQKRVEG